VAAGQGRIVAPGARAMALARSGRGAARMPSGPQTPRRRQRLLEELLATEIAVLRRQAARHSRSSEGAEEALQEAAVRFLSHFEGESLSYALPWMQTTVKRCAWEISRYKRRRPPSFALSPTDCSAAS